MKSVDESEMIAGGPGETRHVGSLAASFLVNALLFGLIFGVYEPAFETNDDAVMMMIASGLADVSPSPHLVFTHVSVGYALKTLYAWMPAVPWYAFYLYGLQWIAWSLILRGLILQRGGRLGAVLYCALFGFFGLRMLMYLQFTSTSILLGSAAIFHLLAQGRDAHRSQAPLASGLLVGGSSLVRFASLQASVLVWAPMLVFHAFENSFRSVVLLAASTLAVVACAAGVHHAVYGGDDAWTEFEKFNAVRGQLHGDPDSRFLPGTLERIGWSETDAWMFSLWFYTDSSIYSTEKLEALHANVDRTHRLENRSKVFAWMNELYTGQFVCALVIAVILLLGANLRGTVRLAATWGWFTILAATLTYFYAVIPLRVGTPMLVSLVLATAIAVGIPAGSFRMRQLQETVALAATIFGVAINIPTFGRLWEASTAHRENAAALTRDYERLGEFDPKGIFVHWPNSLMVDWISPFAVPSDLPQLRVIWLGWPTNSPPWLEKLRHLKIENVYLAIAERDDVHLLYSGANGPGTIRAFERFVKNHYEVEVHMEQTCINPTCDLAVWQPRKPR